ncbi:MAG TPA: CinA family protein [Hyphomicrobiales bacterium]|jgi:nicotinamide-nucleotide amidase
MREILVRQARELLDWCREHELTIVTAESCTGGLLASYLTHIAGASDVVERGYVTYSNESKIELLGVDKEMIDRHGAVSCEVALAMAAGALWRSRAVISAAITGVAGPGGGTEQKPVGLVHFAVAKRVAITSAEMNFSAIHHVESFGDIGRSEIREESVATAMKLLRQTGNL